jgi:hypothetical protein
MASFDTLQKLQEHPEWLPPRSDVRVFLGEPGGPEAAKTTVEPGNVFSPGMMTFGVTWFLRFPGSNRFFATETARMEELIWTFEEGYLPVIHCNVTVEGLQVDHTLFEDGTAAERSEAVCARLRLHNASHEAVTVQIYIALRSLGPAGGEVRALEVGPDGRSLWNLDARLPLLGASRSPDAAGCGVGDPSVSARHGQAPGVQKVKDQGANGSGGWCYGLLRYDVTLPPGADWDVAYDCPIQTNGPVHDILCSSVPPRPEAFAERVERHKDRWRERLGTIQLDVPDADFRNAFFAGVQHLLTAMVGEQPRIAALSYPLPWLRDSVFIVRCFDLAGFHAQAQAASTFIARNDFFGGFGAEGDAPGEGLWALVQHYRITRDKAWLSEVYPAIRRKVDWLKRMRRAEAPIQVFQDAPTLAFTHAQRTAGVICLPGKDGIIQGTMDGGVDYSLGWVNHWAICGLREAAYAAEELGFPDDAAQFRAEADDLQAALKAFADANPIFFTHERTTNSLLWPTRAWANDLATIRAPFEEWWQKNRGDGTEFKAEPYWLYFEESQAHNALLMGQRERAWQALDHRLRHQDLPGLYGWREGGNGVGTDNATRGVTLIPFLRGCQKYDSITPHGWSQAEMWLLQRAALIEEWPVGDGPDGLLLFAGIPAHWLKSGARVAFSGLPTWYGQASAGLEVSSDGKTASISLSGIEPGIEVEIRLPGKTARVVCGEASVNLHVDL